MVDVELFKRVVVTRGRLDTKRNVRSYTTPCVCLAAKQRCDILGGLVLLGCCVLVPVHALNIRRSTMAVCFNASLSVVRRKTAGWLLMVYDVLSYLLFLMAVIMYSWFMMCCPIGCF